MRTGSVEPSRMGKKKRSPKRKHDKMNSQHASIHPQITRQSSECIKNGNTSSAPVSMGTPVSGSSSSLSTVTATTTTSPTNASVTNETSVEENRIESDRKIKDLNNETDLSESVQLSGGVNETAPDEIIATTPAALPMEKTVIDINNSFQVFICFSKVFDKFRNFISVHFD